MKRSKHENDGTTLLVDDGSLKKEKIAKERDVHTYSSCETTHLEMFIISRTTSGRRTEGKEMRRLIIAAR